MPNNKHSIEYLLIFRLGCNWFFQKFVEFRNLMMISCINILYDEIVEILVLSMISMMANKIIHTIKS